MGLLRRCLEWAKRWRCLTGGKVAPPKMTSREGKPEDRCHRSADVNRKPNSESTYKQQRDFSRTPRHRHRLALPATLESRDHVRSAFLKFTWHVCRSAQSARRPAWWRSPRPVLTITSTSSHKSTLASRSTPAVNQARCACFTRSSRRRSARWDERERTELFIQNS